jgi:hypothetical protein
MKDNSMGNPIPQRAAGALTRIATDPLYEAGETL